MQLNTTICALATGGGTSALAIIRVSGPEALSVTDKIFVGKKNKKLINQNGYTLHFGNIVWKNEIIDEVLVSVFKQPHSYTGEHLIEISCHGSIFIQQSILSSLYDAGAIPAKAGEFTLRAFLNKKPLAYSVIPNMKKFMNETLHLNAFPTHFILNKKGQIAKVLLDYEGLEVALKKESQQ